MASLLIGNLSFILSDAELEYLCEATGQPVESDVALRQNDQHMDAIAKGDEYRAHNCEREY